MHGSHATSMWANEWTNEFFGTGIGARLRFLKMGVRRLLMLCLHDLRLGVYSLDVYMRACTVEMAARCSGR